MYTVYVYIYICIPTTSASAKLSLETETSIILVVSENFSSFTEFWSFWVLYHFAMFLGDVLKIHGSSMLVFVAAPPNL